MGKHNPFSKQANDIGDCVVVTNAKKVVFSGDKWKEKIYYKHTHHPGGLKVDYRNIILLLGNPCP